MPQNNNEDIKAVEPEIVTDAIKSEPQKESIGTVYSTTVGCMRYAVLGPLAAIFTLCVAIAVWVKFGFFYAIFAAILFFIISAIFVVHLAENVKKLSVFDCLLPILVGLLSSIFFTPIALAANGSFFSFATCMGASIFLSMMMFLYRAGKIGLGFLIWPFLVFFYEILPFEFPSDLDNIFAFGGNIIVGITAGLKVLFHYDKKQLEQHRY